MKKLFCICLVVVMVASMSISAFASDIVVYQDSTDRVMSSTGDSGVKTERPAMPTPRYLVDIYLNDFYETDFYNDYISVQLYTYFNGSNMGFTYTADGSSGAYWWGGNPYNITSISLKDTLAATGVTGINAGSGWGISIGRGTATFTSTNSNCWDVSHEFQNIKMNGAILYLSHTADATFKYGSSNKTISCSDGSTT